MPGFAAWRGIRPQPGPAWNPGASAPNATGWNPAPGGTPSTPGFDIIGGLKAYKNADKLHGGASKKMAHLGDPGHPATPTGPTPAPAPTSGVSDIYGSESGPTYLEQRYLDRMNGVDAAANYALKRGGDDIDRRMAAGGSYNSGARGQQLSDFGANIYAQSQKQLDELSGAATGARQRKLEGMFGEGLGLAGGQAGISSLYDRSLADFTSQNNLQNLMLQLNRGGVDSKGNNAALNNILSIMGLFA